MVNNSSDKEKNEGDATRASTETGRSLKKGPWTAAEDGILIEYVKKHGEGNWNAVQKHTGLQRCGKSCRLRWANHLRPNLKKGSFSQEEERVIIELHAKLGNKWARMAAQLPGRTDNEIKNYWNTRMKRRQRAGLPLYPLEIQQEATAFHLRQHHHSACSSPSFSALLSPPSLHQKHDYNSSVSLFNFSSAINNPQRNNFSDSSLYATPTNQFKFLFESNGNNNNNNSNSHFVQPLSSLSPFPQIPKNQNGLQLNYGSYVCDSSFNQMIFGTTTYQQVLPCLETELPSIQTPLNSTTPASSGISGGELGRESTQANSNSGLLDALLLEAEALSRNEKCPKEETSSNGEFDTGKQTVEQGSTEEEEPTNENQSDEFSSSHSSTRKRPRMEPVEEMDSMDDDLMSLLNNFPSAMPIPEWYPGGDEELRNSYNRPSLCESNGNLEVEEEHDEQQRQNEEASPSPVPSVVASSPSPAAPDWSLSSSSCWNMPSIC